jgi:predicted nucleic acid-binding protein
MPGVVFDTSVIIAYKLMAFPIGFLMSSVVLQELIAGASDHSEVQKWLAAHRFYEKEKRLLVPTGEDWCEAGRIMNAMLRGLKSKSGGKTPKLQDSEKQGMIRDVLIARTVKRAGALLVTDNRKDFQRIRRFCGIRLVSGGEYFE